MSGSETESRRVLLTFQHPGHVHFFKHAYRELRASNHEAAVVIRNEPVVAELCEAYDIDYRVLSEAADSLPSITAAQLRFEVGRVDTFAGRDRFDDRRPGGVREIPFCSRTRFR